LHIEHLVHNEDDEILITNTII